MKLVIRGSEVVAVYSDRLADALGRLGEKSVSRASHVEPVGDGWTADLSPVGGPVLGPFRYRTEALGAEVAWLDANLRRIR